MEAAQSTFISSTFWTERIGPTAALKTLEIMESEKSWEQITSTGMSIKKGWQQLADANRIEISQFGIPSLAGFNIKSKNSLSYKTLITQEMLSKGYIVSNNVYSCTEHKSYVLDNYFNEMDKIFSLIKRCEEGEEDLSNILKGPVCHSGFKRLN